MKNESMINTDIEQEICISCGLCCDGTLFSFVKIRKNETNELHKKIKERYLRNKDGIYFKQPCPCFQNKCEIYHKCKPKACSLFRCRLLMDLKNGKHSIAESKDIIKNAIQLKNELYSLCEDFLNGKEDLPFKELLINLNQKKLHNNSKMIDGTQFKFILYKRNIFEILLTKHFKPNEEFENLIMK